VSLLVFQKFSPFEISHGFFKQRQPLSSIVTMLISFLEQLLNSIAIAPDHILGGKFITGRVVK
jgi:hypothetical protein